MKPILISIDGAYKSGKTTQAKLLTQKLMIDGYNVKLIHFEKTSEEDCKKLLNNEFEITPKGLLALNYAKLVIMADSVEQNQDYDFIIFDGYELSLLAQNNIYYKSQDNALKSYKIKQPDISIIMATNDIESKYKDISDTDLISKIEKENTILASYKNKKTNNDKEILLINSALNTAINEELIYSLVKMRSEANERQYQ